MKMNCNVSNEVMPDHLRGIILSLYEDIHIEDVEMTQTMFNYNPWINENEYTAGTCSLIVEAYGIWFNMSATAYLEYKGILVLLKKR